MTRTDYIATILSAYCALPHTAARSPRPLDRTHASHLYDRHVPIEIVLAALTVAMARRLTRNPTAPPLPAIRSLAYFDPIIDELIDDPPDPNWIRDLEHRIHA